jgi:hypothetical protein
MPTSPFPVSRSCPLGPSPLGFLPLGLPPSLVRKFLLGSKHRRLAGNLQVPRRPGRRHRPRDPARVPCLNHAKTLREDLPPDVQMRRRRRSPHSVPPKALRSQKPAQALPEAPCGGSLAGPSPGVSEALLHAAHRGEL